MFQPCYTVDKAEIVFIFLSFPRIGKRFGNIFENLINDRPMTLLTNFIVRYDTRDELRNRSNASFFFVPCFENTREHSYLTLTRRTRLSNPAVSSSLKFYSHKREKKQQKRFCNIYIFFALKIKAHRSFQRETFNRRFRISLRRSLRAKNEWRTRKRNSSRRRTEIW